MYYNEYVEDAKICLEYYQAINIILRKWVCGIWLWFNVRAYHLMAILINKQ